VERNLNGEQTTILVPHSDSVPYSHSSLYLKMKKKAKFIINEKEKALFLFIMNEKMKTRREICETAFIKQKNVHVMMMQFILQIINMKMRLCKTSI
jgi:hypothetical protein